uniref:Uncharacterized protein n=1 Tax=Strongyloides papillosus TaxID=174720 RepID=A0A0N5BMG5_STREA
MGLSKIFFFLPRRVETFLNFLLIFLISVFVFIIIINIFGVSPASSNRFSRDILKRLEEHNSKNNDILHVRPDYSIPREGPGENGKAVYLTESEEKLAKEELKTWFMNMQAK